jgi:DNA-directed RNA polymerase specialized sigma54-like protein
MAINGAGRTSLPQKLNMPLTLVRNMRILQGQQAVNVSKICNKSIPENPTLPLIHQGDKKTSLGMLQFGNRFTSPLKANKNENKATYWYKIAGIYLSIHVNA